MSDPQIHPDRLLPVYLSLRTAACHLYPSHDRLIHPCRPITLPRAYPSASSSKPTLPSSSTALRPSTSPSCAKCRTRSLPLPLPRQPPLHHKPPGRMSRCARPRRRRQRLRKSRAPRAAEGSRRRRGRKRSSMCVYYADICHVIRLVCAEPYSEPSGRDGLAI